MFLPASPTGAGQKDVPAEKWAVGLQTSITRKFATLTLLGIQPPNSRATGFRSTVPRLLFQKQMLLPVGP
jgi:hypothetical protein